MIPAKSKNKGTRNNKAMTSALSKVIPFLLLLLLPVFPAQAQTAPAIVAPYPVTHIDPMVDLSVKVWGGSITIQRGYLDGEWHPNPNWLPLKLTYDSFDSSIKTITRGRTDYNKVAPGVYQDTHANTLRQTTTGFRWFDPQANWIEYNPAGEVKSYGDRNGTIATFKYSGSAGQINSSGVPLSEGRITGIFDHYDTQVLWFSYDTANTLSNIRDTSGRQVSYQWTPTPNGITLDVTDTNGNPWHYVLSGILPGAATSGSFGPVPADITGALGTGLNTTDPEGHTTSRRWYTNGALATITQPDGSQTRTLQDFNAATSTFYYREIAPGGKTTETWSDLRHDLSRGEYQRRDLNGTTISKQSVDTATRTTTYTDARGLNTAYTRDQWDNITKVEYPDGSSVNTRYSATYSNVTQLTDENGTINQYTYDTKGNLVKAVEALGTTEQRTTEYTNNTDGQRTSMTRKGDANTVDATTQYEYDTNGNLSKITDAEGGITQITYDVMGNPLTKTDPRGKLWKRTYDKQVHLTSITDPLNRTNTIGYDKAGHPISLTDAAGNVSTLGYDAAGKLLTVTDPYGAITKLTYDAANNPVTVTDAENHTRKQEFDLDGRLIKQTDGNNNVAQFIYGDAASGLNGLLAKVIYPTKSKELKYDTLNRITQSTESSPGALQTNVEAFASQTSKNQFDRAGNLTAVTNAANKTAAIQYDALGRVRQITDPAGGLTQYGYDARGNLISVKDAKGNTHRFEYDRLNRMVKETLPLGQSVTYTYDGNSNLVQLTDPKGQVKKYVFDDANRLIQQNHYLTATDITPIKTINYSYNILGSLTGYTDGTTTSTYTYDAKQLRKTGQSVNYGTFTLATSTTYNSLGQKSSLSYPDGASYSYTYDTNNQLSSVNLPTGFGSITFNSYTWTVPAQITLPGGTIRNQQYDGLLRLKDLNVKDPSQSQVMNYRYNYDLSSNITSKATEAGSTSYGYDTLDHLTSATYTGTGQTNEAYTYDGIANRLTDSKTAAATWVYDANNQLTSAGTISYTYDNNGNATNQTDSVNAANTRNYIYDTEDRMIEVRNASSVLIAAYSYDPFGRRLSKDAGTSKTYYFYNEEGLIAEADANGQITKSYGYAPGSTFSTYPLWQKSGTAYYTYQNDHLGTPMKLLSQSGVVVWSASYEAFGKATVSPASTISNNLRFPGQYYDQETNLHYNRMRYYDAGTGRYVTRDPMGLNGGMNTYGYAKGNPLKWADPYGLYSTAAHNKIINAFFGTRSKYSKDNIREIRNGSALADALQYQGEKYAYMHAMSSAVLTKKKSCKEFKKYIIEKIDGFNEHLEAAKSQRGPILWDEVDELTVAYQELGRGLHAVMDFTSPAHDGPDHSGFYLWETKNMWEHGPWPNSIEDDDDVTDTLMSRTHNLIEMAMNKDLSFVDCNQYECQ